MNIGEPLWTLREQLLRRAIYGVLYEAAEQLISEDSEVLGGYSPADVVAAQQAVTNDLLALLDTEPGAIEV